ncbi:MAG: hypothetical protein ACFCU6_03275, partial [Balneolaceae bacterium]
MVEHPIEERIPFYDFNHILIDIKNSFITLNQKSQELVLLYQYLQNPEKIAFEKLDLLVGSPFPAFNVVSFGDDRLVILDDNSNKLHEYNLETKKASVISDFGRGPGDFQFPLEMVKHHDMIYILREDMFLSVFDCKENPCLHNDDISLQFTPSSLATFKNKFAILGGRVDNENVEGTNSHQMLDYSKSVHIIDKNSEEISSFGKIYDINGHWMLHRPFVLNGKVRYGEYDDKFVLAFKPFPYIYIYDANDLRIENTFKLSDFLLSKQKYWPNERRLRTPEEDFSYINNIEVFNGHLLWIEVETKTNYRITESSILWDRKLDYYVIDLSDRASYYMGYYEYK